MERDEVFAKEGTMGRESDGNSQIETRIETTRIETPGDIVSAWEHLSEEQRELLIPRLLRSTELGRRAVPAAGIAWRPDYER